MSTSGAPAGGKGIAININSVTADGIKASQKAAEAQTASGKKAQKGKEKMSDLLQEQVLRDAFRKPPKPPTPVSREQKEYIARGNKFDPKKLDPNFVTADEKEAAWYARTIFKYYQAFPEKLGKMPTVKAIDPSSPGALPKLKEHLSQIQSVMGSTFSEEVSMIGLVSLGTAIEFGWQIFCYGQPWNPLGGMDLSNLGAETKQLYGLFEDELKELQILYADWFEQGVWTRFFSKLIFVAKEVAEKNAKKGVEANQTAAQMSTDPQFSDL
jgi:hypothetical protein